MPMYTYRREDGSTFDTRQSFHDAPLTTDPESGQKVVRVVHNTGVIFKGSGFYINDSKSSKESLSATGKKKSDSATTTAKTGDSATSAAAD